MIIQYLAKYLQFKDQPGLFPATVTEIARGVLPEDMGLGGRS